MTTYIICRTTGNDQDKLLAILQSLEIPYRFGTFSKNSCYIGPLSEEQDAIAVQSILTESNLESRIETV
jgi:hypothetical protein